MKKASRLGAALPLILILTASGCVPLPRSPELPAASPAGSSVVDGVFTLPQAARGQRRFEQICEACHRTQEFSGARFQIAWMSRTVGDIFQLISNTMPPDSPGSLSPEEYTDILTYFLRLNGYPAGQEELPADPPTLLDVRIEAPP